MSKFQRRHYEALALVMQETYPVKGLGDRAVVQWKYTVHTLAQMFIQDNSGFEFNRFLEACIPGNNVKATV